jgi:hypothetical protein
MLMKKIICLLVEASKYLYGKGKKHVCRGVNLDQILPLFKPPLLQSPHKMNQFKKSNLVGWDW